MDLKVSVNLSTRNLLDPTCPQDVAAPARRGGACPHPSLELEITESTMMVDPQRSLEVLKRLHNMGIAPVDRRLRDRLLVARVPEGAARQRAEDRPSFVEAMTSNRGDAFIVRSTIDLAHNLEPAGRGRGRRGPGDDGRARGPRLQPVAQGFHLSRPLPPQDFTTWLASSGIVALAERDVA